MLTIGSRAQVDKLWLDTIKSGATAHYVAQELEFYLVKRESVYIVTSTFYCLNNTNYTEVMFCANIICSKFNSRWRMSSQ